MNTTYFYQNDFFPSLFLYTSENLCEKYISSFIRILPGKLLRRVKLSLGLKKCNNAFYLRVQYTFSRCHGMGQQFYKCYLTPFYIVPRPLVLSVISTKYSN